MIGKGKEIESEREESRREENTEKTDKEKNENSGIRARGKTLSY